MKPASSFTSGFTPGGNGAFGLGFKLGGSGLAVGLMPGRDLAGSACIVRPFSTGGTGMGLAGAAVACGCIAAGTPTVGGAALPGGLGRWGFQPQLHKSYLCYSHNRRHSPSHPAPCFHTHRHPHPKLHIPLCCHHRETVTRRSAGRLPTRSRHRGPTAPQTPQAMAPPQPDSVLPLMRLLLAKTSAAERKR
jgi:hypothetical protein